MGLLTHSVCTRPGHSAEDTEEGKGFNYSKRVRIGSKKTSESQVNQSPLKAPWWWFGAQESYDHRVGEGNCSEVLESPSPQFLHWDNEGIENEIPKVSSSPYLLDGVERGHLVPPTLQIVSLPTSIAFTEQVGFDGW